MRRIISNSIFFLNSFIHSRKTQTIMKKQTLKFNCLANMAIFSRQLITGYLMNTNNFTITGKFSEEEIDLAIKKYRAAVIETTEKVFSYLTGV